MLSDDKKVVEELVLCGFTITNMFSKESWNEDNYLER